MLLLVMLVACHAMPLLAMHTSLASAQTTRSTCAVTSATTSSWCMSVLPTKPAARQMQVRVVSSHAGSRQLPIRCWLMPAHCAAMCCNTSNHGVCAATDNTPLPEVWSDNTAKPREVRPCPNACMH